MTERSGNSTDPARTTTMTDDQEPRSFRRWQWRVLIGSMICYLFYYTGRQAYGFAIPGIQKEYGIDKAVLGGISGLMLWCYALGQFGMGALADRFSGRRLMAAGAVLSTIANLVVSVVGSVVGIGVAWGANGLFQAMGWSSGSRVVSHWWAKRERGTAFSLYTAAAGMASVVAYVLAVLVVDVWHLDWQWVFRGPVLLMFGGAVVLLVLARERPRDAGFPDDVIELDDPSVRGPAESSDGTTRRTGVFTGYREVLRVPGIWIAGVSIGFQNAARYALLVWVPVYFISDTGGGTTGGGAIWTSVALPVGMAAGALSNGFVSDRLFGSRRAPAITSYMLLATAAAVGMYFVPRGSILGLVLLFVAGFLVYGPQSSFWALCPDLVGARLTATAVGIVDGFAYLFAGVEEPVVGHVLDVSGQASVVFLIVAASCLVSGLVSMAIRQ
jgi:MFS transporter, OPA family, glycerol-3-phosphate transporter